MQPGPTEDSHRASSSKSAATLHNSSQHGSSNPHDALPGPSRRSYPEREGSAVDYGPIDGPISAHSRLSRQISPASREHSPGTTTGTSPPAQPKSKTKNRGQTYITIARSKGTYRGGTQLLDLPNEILTHVLSYLPADSLTTAALVSQRFHQLVTTPHAWRAAFLRYFPGSRGTARAHTQNDTHSDVQGGLSFTRLTALSSWRTEYILRTRLLRSLARGKPPNPSSTSTHPGSRARQANSFVLYDSQMPDIVDCLHGDFGSGFDNRRPKFRYGTTEGGRTGSSDPFNSAPDTWGRHDIQHIRTFGGSVFGGHELYGLGAGNIVGNPNPMDVSHPYGMILGEGIPGGKAYFHHIGEQRGRFISNAEPPAPAAEMGIPNLDPSRETVCSVWIAKTTNIPTISNGYLGMLSGASNGVLTAYSLGTDAVAETHLQRGEITAKWSLCPGVPIVGIKVDDSYNMKRYGKGRVVAFVLNALGEIFYLKKLFSREQGAVTGILSDAHADRLAWMTGRSVPWHLIESTRRASAANTACDGPRSSWIGSRLTLAEIAAETHEIEAMSIKRPKYFQENFNGWDMQRRFEVDFAGDDEQGAGESLLLFDCGVKDGANLSAKATRLLRRNAASPLPESVTSTHLATSPIDADRSNTSGIDGPSDIWMRSDFSLGDLEAPELVTTAIDGSNYATVTIEEDPLLTLATSTGSSPWSSPGGTMPRPASAFEIPGHRARLVAAGTDSGCILLWDMRAPTSPSPELSNTIAPLRIIRTDSPRVTCLALSALYFVHGGSDGLVQAWDPLASDAGPIRTLNSRYSIRARRRFVIANTTPENTRPNFFIAGAIALDPDATRLRGMVSLGSLLRYWSYSTDAADQYRRSKRRWRRAHRGSNHGDPTVAPTSRVSGAMKGFIADEQAELERERRVDRSEQARLASRFGIGLLGPGATEDEMLAYATMLSAEAEEQRHSSQGDDNGTASPEPVAGRSHPLTTPPTTPPVTTIPDTDLDEAIRRSLQDSDPSSSPEAFAVRYVPDRRRSPRTSPRSPPAPGPSGHISGGSHTRAENATSSTPGAEADDVEFALQLSLAEERSRVEAEAAGVVEAVEQLQVHGEVATERKGKGKERAR